ncbi:MAG: Hpt domain-containing protein [Sulfurimonas sp.]|nr:Hpt domain-containing protein [Sulfurimonas sp.]
MAIQIADYANINHDEMAEKIGIRTKHIPALISTFLKESISILEKLQIAIDAKDYKEISSQAHSIKGSAGNLRFNEVYEMSSEVELSARDANEEFEYQVFLDAIKKAVSTIS